MVCSARSSSTAMFPLSTAGTPSVWKDGVPFKIHSDVTGADGERIRGVQDTSVDVFAGQSIGNVDHATVEHQKHGTARGACPFECITKLFVLGWHNEWNDDGSETIVILVKQVGHGLGVQRWHLRDTIGKHAAADGTENRNFTAERLET